MDNYLDNEICIIIIAGQHMLSNIICIMSFVSLKEMIMYKHLLDFPCGIMLSFLAIVFLLCWGLYITLLFKMYINMIIYQYKKFFVQVQVLENLPLYHG